MKHCFIVFVLLTPLAANSASFDCQKVKAADEKAICASQYLNDKDVEMATKYQFLKGLFAMGARVELQDSQQVWLSERHRCASNFSCLSQIYKRRLQALDKIYAGIEKPL